MPQEAAGGWDDESNDNRVPLERALAALQGATGYKFCLDGGLQDRMPDQPHYRAFPQIAALVPFDKAQPLVDALNKIAKESGVHARGAAEAWEHPHASKIVMPLEEFAKQVRYASEHVPTLPEGQHYAEVLIPPSIALDEHFLELVANNAIDLQTHASDMRKPELTVLEAADCDLLERLFGSYGTGWYVAPNGKYAFEGNYDQGLKVKEALELRGLEPDICVGSQMFVAITKEQMESVRSFSMAERQAAMDEVAARPGVIAR